MKIRLIIAATALALLLPFCAHAENIQYGPPASGGGSAPCNAFGTTAGKCAQGNDRRLYSASYDAIAMGAKFDGTTDDTAVLNTAIQTIKASGGGILYLPAAKTHLSGLLLDDKVSVIGAGSSSGTTGGAVGGTRIVCDASPCITQVTNSALIGITFTDMHFAPGAGQTAATVLLLPDIALSDVGRFTFEGFTTGTIQNVGGTPASPITDGNIGGNVIFNRFHDYVAFGCGTCLIIHGAYVDNAGVPSAPTQANTNNNYDNMVFYNVTVACVEVIRASDSTRFNGGLCLPNTDNVTHIILGDDPNYAPGTNIFVDGYRFTNWIFSGIGNAHPMTFFGGYGGWDTEGINLDTDQIVGPADVATANATLFGPNFPCSYHLQGKNLSGTYGANLLAIHPDILDCGTNWRREVTISENTTGFTLTTPEGSNSVLVSGSANLATGTIRLPCDMPDGTVMTYFTQALIVQKLTVLTCAGNPAPFASAPKYFGPNDPFSAYYLQSSNTWIAAGKNGGWGGLGTVTVADGDVVVTPTGNNEILLSASGASPYATLTIQLPCSPPDGLLIGYATTTLTVTAATFQGCSGAGAAVFGAAATITPNDPAAFRYVSSSNTWLRRSGGVGTYAAVSNQWINAIAASGAPSSTQPAFTNISGTVAANQLPLPSTFHAAYIICRSGTAVSHTGDTTETNLATCQIPANTLGAAGAIRITTLWTYTNSANTKNLIVRYSTASGGVAGTQYTSNAVTTTAIRRSYAEIGNTNATNAQHGLTANLDFGTGTGALVTSALDTTAATFVNINCIASATDTVTLVDYTVEVVVP